MKNKHFIIGTLIFGTFTLAVIWGVMEFIIYGLKLIFGLI